MKEIVLEGFEDSLTPSMKYYAFDWDDNIVHMPTKIIVKNDEGKEVGMGTEDFAIFRDQIGKKDFRYKGDTIVGYADEPFRNFREEGDKQFLIDAMKSKTGPAFEDFREAINNGSIFSIITARGHNPNTLKQAVYNYIVTGFNGIDKEKLLKNLKKYRNFTDEEDMNDVELIKNYLNLNKYHPVSFKTDMGAASPEELKIMAMDSFIEYIREMAAILNKKAYLKKELGNKFIPKIHTIGFSDDDIKNIEAIKKHYKEKPDKEVTTYYTGTGDKKKI